MPNLHRGEIEAHLDGRPHRLCLTLGALAELESVFGDEDMLALAERFGRGRLAVAGTPQVQGADFDIDATTGLVTFRAGHSPAVGAAITAGFEFDVPVRFDTDKLEINVSGFRHGAIPAIPIVEIRL